MDEYTIKLKAQLEERFERGVSERRYFSHRPIYGFGQGPSEPSHTARMSLALAILRILNNIEGASLLDLGGGEGYMAALARDLLGYNPLMVELPESACRRARELFAVPAISASVNELPVADNNADVAMMSEVIEHLRDPVGALEEAWRVTKRTLIITTQEVSPWEWERKERMKLRNLEKWHAELTFFHPNDFRAIFGKNVELLNPCLAAGLKSETQITEKEARMLIPKLAEPSPYGPGSLGIMAVVKKQHIRLKNPRLSDSLLITRFFDFKVPLPNISRSSMVYFPSWYKTKINKGSEQEKDPDLSANWDAKTRSYVERLRRLQNQKTANGVLPKIRARIMLALAVSIRFWLAPGTLRMKLEWIIETLNLRMLKKALGG
jgi:SAM-dependent methyltransferase